MKYYCIQILLLLTAVNAFCPAPTRMMGVGSALFSATLQEIEKMKASEIKNELESYGISTKAFLEKSELIEALKDARAKGLKPKKTATRASSTSTTTSSSSASGSSSSSSGKTTDKPSKENRDEKLKEQRKACETMKVSELKAELKSLGVSTKALFEKSELVEALAAARVDGVKKVQDDDEEEAVYADVEVITDNVTGPRAKGSQQRESSAGGGSPFGAGSPFGSGSPFGGGGMGGMNLEDLMQGMGGGFGGRASPFGGAPGGMNLEDIMKGMGGFGNMGGMGGMGNAMGKAQEMMKNPKVQAIMAKAQKNPAMMKKVNECMSNPASFTKYQNDPEVKELVEELRKYM